MLLLMMTMLQPAEADATSSVKFPRYTEPPRRCAATADAASDEIVVCATRSDKYRINPLPPAGQPGLPKAERNLGNGTVVNVHTEQAEVGGQPSKRAMVTLKIGF